MSREYTGKQLISLEEKRKKRKENKEKLVEQVIGVLQEDAYGYYDFTYDLVREALWRRTNKKIREIL
jgi:hypothetical protein